MAVQPPPITGDPEQDSFNQQVADAINFMPLGNVITEERIIASSVAGTRGAAGADGLNRAGLYLFQRTGINEVNGLTAPDRLSENFTLQYNYSNATLRGRDAIGGFTVGPPWEGWYDTIPDRNPALQDDYVWFQFVAIADRDNTDLIAGGSWSGVGLFARPGVGALRTVVEYNTLVDGTLDPNRQVYEARITHIYLGERDVTAQIEPSRICWLVAEDDGTFAADSAILLADGTLPATYSDRNFENGQPRQTGFTATFPATLAAGGVENLSQHIFSGSTANNYSDVSRDIEPRIEIGAVVNI